MTETEVRVGGVTLLGILEVPKDVKSLVLFVHGSGSSRLSPRNSYVARVLNEAGMATFLLDLLTEDEDAIYENRFNIELLTERLKAVCLWCQERGETSGLKLGLFGASTGAAAALSAASVLPEVRAIVSRGGRPDLAGEALFKVRVPTLLMVGGLDAQVIELNQSAYEKLGGVHKIEIVPGATHLFEEPGTLEKVAELARDWFKQYLK